MQAIADAQSICPNDGRRASRIRMRTHLLLLDRSNAALAKQNNRFPLGCHIHDRVIWQSGPGDTKYSHDNDCAL